MVSRGPKHPATVNVMKAEADNTGAPVTQITCGSLLSRLWVRAREYRRSGHGWEWCGSDGEVTSEEETDPWEQRRGGRRKEGISPAPMARGGGRGVEVLPQGGC
jgi:hypothetical protein